MDNVPYGEARVCSFFGPSDWTFQFQMGRTRALKVLELKKSSFGGARAGGVLSNQKRGKAERKNRCTGIADEAVGETKVEWKYR